MNIFHFEQGTGEYLSSGIARENPLEPGKYLVPAYATIEEPPVTSNNEVALYINNKWTIRADYREGVWYNKETKEEVRITDINNIPGDTLTAKKPGQYDVWDDTIDDWTCDIVKLKQAKVADIQEQGGAVILEQYPIFKQININQLQGYTQGDKDQMWTFINMIRDQCNTMEFDIAAFSEADDIVNYKVTFNIE